MAPDEAAKPEMSQPESTGARPAPRRDRRPPGRGRRGRGRGRGPKPAPTAAESDAIRPAAELAPGEPEAIFELAEEGIAQSGPEAEEPEVSEPVSEPMSPPAPKVPSRPASQTSVEEAIEEVTGIVETLRTSLEDMEEVLELLEVFERQKNADEREIDSLRRALRQVHRPREGGHHQHR